MTWSYLHEFGGRKPDLPYRKGTRLTLTSHIASAPLKEDEEYSNLLLSDENREEHQFQHPLELCRTRGPREGLIDQHAIRIDAEVVCEIKVSNMRHAQVVMVEILEASKNAPSNISRGGRYVAKFYDPLYNNHGDGAQDHWILADRHYTKEVAAYKQLADIQGEVVPVFYGSFSTDFNIRFEPEMMGQLDSQTRIPPSVVKHVVRCILIEYIDGTVLYDVPTDIPNSMSQSIMKAILDAEAQLYLRDVVHVDLQPKNIILNKHQEKFKAVLLDFADANLARNPDESILGDIDYFNGHFVSPLLRWDIGNDGGEEYPGGEELSPWVHFDWQSWLERTYGEDVLELEPQKLAAMRRTFVTRCFEV